MRRCALPVLLLLLGASARAEAPALAVQVLGSGGPRPSAQASSGTAGPGGRGGPHPGRRRPRDVASGRGAAGWTCRSSTRCSSPTCTRITRSSCPRSRRCARSMDAARTSLRVVGPDGNAAFPSTRRIRLGAARSAGRVPVRAPLRGRAHHRGDRRPGGSARCAEAALARRGSGRHRAGTPPRGCAGGRLPHRARRQDASSWSATSTRPGSPAVEQLAAGADLLVISCSVLDPPDSPPGLYERHSPPSAIGRDGRAGPGEGAALHASAAGGEGASDALRRSLAVGFPGPVTLATDGLVVPVVRRRACARATDADCSPAQSCL